MADPMPFFDQKHRRIGLQLYTLGDDAGADLDATFAQVAKIGYRDIELPGLYGQSPAAIAAAARRAGVEISSLHLAVSTRSGVEGLSLASPPDAIAAALGELGAARAVMPIALFPEGMQPREGETPQQMIARSFAAVGSDIWFRTAAKLNETAAALRPHGIRLGYHNHNLEFAPLGRENGWDILTRECEPRLVDFEVDTGWVATAGIDVAGFIRRYGERITQLHVKDVAVGGKVNFALAMEPAEVGAGALDWPSIFTAARDAGVQHYYVEQEPPFSIPRFEAIRRAYSYLDRLTV
ncbi:sugar phosphate isomerase/epimerase family protein [Novosphingobium endophyticum]|nr:sugar phosphate isomerase/epimerase [Novosphingobium endophyticum]